LYLYISLNEYFKTNYKILLNKFFVILKLDATFNHKFASTKNNHNLSNHTTMSSLRHYLLIFYFLILTTTIAISQNSQEDQNDDPTPGWVYMMGDMDANFYDVQKIATEYYRINSQGKGSGWKQFKRWEYFTEPRVYPTGNRINHAQIWNEISKFNASNTGNNRMLQNSWLPMGPSTSANVTGHWNPGLGRINVIAVDPNDSNIIYIGSPSGGLWKTLDEGANWTPLTDNQPVLGVSAIAINPNNTDVLYIGTGDKDSGDNYSIGVLKSLDGGNSWNTTGLDWTINQNRTIAKLIINSNNTDILYAATTSGLYRTTDAGVSWFKVLSGDIDDLEFKPGNPNVVYAIAPRKFYKSTDGGDTFVETTGVPTSGRAQIAVTDDNPYYVYYFSSNNGIYRSEDSGDSFTKMSSQPNQGSQAWYDLAFCVSDMDANEVHLGEINTWRSTTGGTSWTKTTNWTWNNPIGYTHCDIHEMVFYNGTLYVGSDGLISKSTDGGNNWINLSEGLTIRQFYKIGTSKNDPYKILGGSQDNGTSVYTTNHWHEWLGADGMECIPDYTNSNIVYGTSQNGVFYKSTSGGNNGGANITQPGGGNWVTPFVMHPEDPQTLFVGSSEVKKTTNGMMSWTTISNFGMGNLNNLAIAESNGDYLYASRDDNIYRTSNGGASWSSISNGLPNLSISYIAVHPEDPLTIAVSLSGFTNGEKVYTSEDGGSNWINYSSNLPNIPANCVAFGIGDINPLYVGMDVGVYYTDGNLTEWNSFMDNLPNVIVNELEINIDAQLIRAATYGRGLWENTLIIYDPQALFEADQTLIPIDCSINFNSLSQGPPQTYEWIFEGANPSTSTDKNPIDISYNTPGSWDVQLIVTNSLGSDTLLIEDYITVSATLLPEPDFMTEDSIACSDNELQLYDLSLYCPSTWEWNFSPSTVTYLDGTNANSQNPKVSFEPGLYTVELTTSNSIGSNSLTKVDYIQAGGKQLPFIEDFEATSLTDRGWTVENPDEQIGWEMKEVLGNNPGNKAPYMNMINYPKFGERDRMISPSLNFTGMSNLHLRFEYAYAQRYYQKDSLIVKISNDCGITWSRIYANGPDGSGIFATSPTNENEFEPQNSEDWCGEGYGAQCVLLDLTAWQGVPNVKIMFESYCHYGNNLYIDNVLIANNVGVSEQNLNNETFEVIPNPSDGLFNISATNITGKYDIIIRNIHGQVVWNKNYSDSQTAASYEVNLSEEAKGVYFVEIKSANKTMSQKLVIK
jgi:PKD repeat protein